MAAMRLLATCLALAAADPLLQDDCEECQVDLRQLRAGLLKEVPVPTKEEPVEPAVLATVKKAPVVEHLVYGASPNFCLSSDGNRIKNNVKLHLWECDRSWTSVGQNFHVDEAGRIRSSADPAYCVVIDGDKSVNGAKIQLWECNDANENQRWSVPNQGQIPSHSNYDMRLVVDGNHASNGAKIQLWSCGALSTEAAKLQDWVKVTRAPSGRAYATPHEDYACQAPFKAVERAQCAEAADTLQPGEGCYG
ncbi:unnamed protein product [Effrenium voratum]|nr:unnamed protein product [Effrenium voratum]